MKNIAIIPARSGSKGLPNKNIRIIEGKPLIAYSIEAAVESGMFDVVHVSTDSEQYAEISREYGADVPFLRSEELATDTASTWDAVREAIKKYRQLGYCFETVMLLQPTTPLRTAADILEAFELKQDKKATSIISVCEVDHSPLWCDNIPKDGNMAGFGTRELSWVTRQDLKQFYRVNGAIYLMDVARIMLEDDNHIYDDNCYALFMDRKKSIDIDSEDDIGIVEYYIKQRNRTL
ncbi:MAG: acylneuraminate cytidylyltransferase family protein [Eubacteriales bacterium]|nr:acylneuraminate cytidylyltransferase family protein [Eubacteriales bacterium]